MVLGVAWVEGDGQVDAAGGLDGRVGELPLGHLRPHPFLVHLYCVRVRGCLVPLARDLLLWGRREGRRRGMISI